MNPALPLWRAEWRLCSVANFLQRFLAEKPLVETDALRGDDQCCNHCLPCALDFKDVEASQGIVVNVSDYYS